MPCSELISTFEIKLRTYKSNATLSGRVAFVVRFVAMIEIELRGRLSDQQREHLLTFLKEKGTYKQTKNRLMLDYSTFMPEQNVRDRTKDIRLRITNGVPEIVTKLGSWGGDEHRKEISIKCEEDSFDRLVENYGELGFEKAILAVRNTEVYDYEKFEFAIVEVPNHSYYFEIEVEMPDGTDTTGIKQEMRELCDSLSLDIFNDEKFYAYIEELNAEANEVFEYKDHHDTYFKDRLSQ